MGGPKDPAIIPSVQTSDHWWVYSNVNICIGLWVLTCSYRTSGNVPVSSGARPWWRGGAGVEENKWAPSMLTLSVWSYIRLVSCHTAPTASGPPDSSIQLGPKEPIPKPRMGAHAVPLLPELQLQALFFSLFQPSTKQCFLCPSTHAKKIFIRRGGSEDPLAFVSVEDASLSPTPQKDITCSWLDIVFQVLI